MPKHKENKIWMLRKDGESNGYVKTMNNKSSSKLNFFIYIFSRNNIDFLEE
jgi:hypothetical protein